MTLTIHHCPFCPVRALAYDGDASLYEAHLKNVHKYP